MDIISNKRARVKITEQFVSVAFSITFPGRHQSMAFVDSQYETKVKEVDCVIHLSIHKLNMSLNVYIVLIAEYRGRSLSTLAKPFFT